MGTVSGFSFRKDFGCWWPDYDHKPEVAFALLKRDVSDMQEAVGLCKHRNQVIQAGGNIGLWPLALAKTFHSVHTFEPEPILFECLSRNIEGAAIKAWPMALGDFVGEVKLRRSVSAGTGRIDPEGTVPVKQTTIDTLGLTKVSAIFLDIEGYEAAALRGAKQTIARCRPIIHVEMLPRSAQEIHGVLKDYDYIRVRRVHKDEVYVPR